MNHPPIPPHPGLVLAEFRLICGSSSDKDRFLGRAWMPAVPAPGEVCNIDGDPYVVHERGWALSTEDREEGPGPVCCYLRVTRLQSS